MGVGRPIPEGDSEREGHRHLDRGAWNNGSPKPMSDIPTARASSDQIKQAPYS